MSKGASERRAAPPLLVVISGPSGVGKDTVMRGALERDERLTRALTMTDRPRRSHEVDGVHYDFVTTEDFESQIEAGELLEHAVVHGQYKGSPRRRVREALASGRDVLLQLDVQGARTLRALVPGALFVYLAPDPSSDLDAHLRGRHEDEATIARRRQDREDELAAASEYDHVIVNREGDPDAAAEALVELLERERAREGRANLEV
ncbi:MAG: guanylate kinase [Dehalococcoidia bacterium]